MRVLVGDWFREEVETSWKNWCLAMFVVENLGWNDIRSQRFLSSGIYAFDLAPSPLLRYARARGEHDERA